MMRADRLLSLLILLQTHGRMTAHSLAKELEVSERSIYRDFIVLSAAGFPILSDAGRGGGYSLLEGYQTKVTGLTYSEVSALGMLSIPHALEELGMGQGLKSAFLKLLVSLNDNQIRKQLWMKQRFLLDASYPNDKPTNPLLGTVHKATWEDRLLKCRFRFSIFTGLTDWIILAPYSLIASSGSWYLVASTNNSLKIYSLAHLLQAELTEEHFVRPDNYDLSEYWNTWRTAMQEVNRHTFQVDLLISPKLLETLPTYWDIPLEKIGDYSGNKCVVRMVFDNFSQARTLLLGFGNAIEIIKPEQLRLSVQDFAQQILSVYLE